MRWYIRNMTEKTHFHTFTFCTEDWERIRRALTVYASSLQVDKSEAANEERAYANALSADINFKL